MKLSKSVKFSTDELKDIIHKYYKDGGSLGKGFSFSNLARYAKENLGIVGIDYYHFARNKEVSAMINEYKKSLRTSAIRYGNDESMLISLDIKEFVKKNCGDAAKLTFMLTTLQQAQKKLYDNNVNVNIEFKQLKSKVETLEDERDKLKIKYSKLKEDNKRLLKETKALRAALNIKDEKQLIEALNSTGLYEVKIEEKSDVSENIKTLDDNNGKDIEKLLDQYSDLFG
jgi:predicted nuclease with TOPRIM domain